MWRWSYRRASLATLGRRLDSRSGVEASKERLREAAALGGGGRGGRRDGDDGRQARFPWSAAVSTVVVGAAAVALYNREWARVKPKLQTIEHRGEALIGGPFSLVDTDGRPVTSASFHGRFVLLYFGFTFCPDICPGELYKMERIRNRLADVYGFSKDDIVPVFVTVDPWRDSVAKVRDYLADFHADFVGLTGTPDQVRDMARKFRVYSENTTQKTVVYGDEDDYLVDHSVFKYLLLPDGSGRVAEWYGADLDDAEVARRIAEKMKEYGHFGNPSFSAAMADTWQYIKRRLSPPV